MAFTVPTMPLPVSIWHQWVDGTQAYFTPDVSTTGNITPGKRSMIGFEPTESGGVSIFQMELLLPALTDIRPNTTFGVPDLVECPQFSGRFYVVGYVDDIGKGFANEHRFCLMNMWMKDTNWTDVGNAPFTIPIQ